MEPLKNLLSPAVSREIATAISRSYPSFNKRAFLKNIDDELDKLELKQRVVFIMQRLHETLPSEVPAALEILRNAIQQDETDKVGLKGFKVWPLTTYVSVYGLDHWEDSMEALYSMTQVFTAEWDIRPFLIHHESRTLKQLKRWTEDPSEHVRRLVSEGSRPLLPWGARLSKFASDPKITWELLEALKHDPALYVRKSVANHINDHTKLHGSWVVERLTDWQSSAYKSLPAKTASSKAIRSEDTVANLNWIIRHATRTLVKKGDQGALKLHGIGSTKLEVLSAKVLTPKVKLGNTLEVSVKIKNPTNKDVAVIIDNEILFLKSNGGHAPKIFKGKKVTIAAQASTTVEMRIPIRPVSVRKYYVGLQYWAAVINGKKTDSYKFLLEK